MPSLGKYCKCLKAKLSSIKNSFTKFKCGDKTPEEQEASRQNGPNQERLDNTSPACSGSYSASRSITPTTRPINIDTKASDDFLTTLSLANNPNTEQDELRCSTILQDRQRYIDHLLSRIRGEDNNSDEFHDCGESFLSTVLAETSVVQATDSGDEEFFDCIEYHVGGNGEKAESDSEVKLPASNRTGVLRKWRGRGPGSRNVQCGSVCEGTVHKRHQEAERENSNGKSSRLFRGAGELFRKQNNFSKRPVECQVLGI
ncbi:hypothetical protein K470DRAFT_270127 [Piedraia hortae CBS 480.64]|uniref:Uncharacterized protein n=1 Tax=Piedraia hortae CBS 480.64 TaxID=1314780 RepID=A0A6A7C1G9_9PEZI|nr:hypothetical protein K470DRAFT_270127 [Piedraia hortae CBS 480.64]